MKQYALLVAALALAGGVAGVAAADSGPLADAGLDQEVTANTTVYLDATGSSHPDGSVDDYEWSIETPDGRQIRPACPTCARTEFTPTDPGRYNVTVTVADGDGRADSDTLFVHVEEAGPTVDLDGETEPPTNEETPYVATVETTNAELETITWRVDDWTVAETSLEGTDDRDDRSLTFTTADRRRLEVIVRDSRERTDSDVLMIDPRESDQSRGDTDESDWRPADSPDEFSASSSDDTVEPDDEEKANDCINGVFVEGNSGCVGHISDASHTDQDEGCEEDFCGVENPAGEIDRGDRLSDDDSYSDEISLNLRSDYGSSSRSSPGRQSSHNSVGVKNNDAGYITM